MRHFTCHLNDLPKNINKFHAILAHTKVPVNLFLDLSGRNPTDRLVTTCGVINYLPFR
jgi:hypothetical protein